MKIYPFDFLLNRLRINTIIDIDPHSKTHLCCPYCGSILEPGEKKRLQSLDEHVTYPNDEATYKDTYYCTIDSCMLGKRHCWNANGESYRIYPNYGRPSFIEDVENHCISIEKRYYSSAINSNARSEEGTGFSYSNFEYKHKVDLHPILCFYKSMPYLSVSYPMTKAGELISINFSVEYLRKDPNRPNNGYCIHGTPFVRGMKFIFNNYKKERKKKNFDKQKYINNLINRDHVPAHYKIIKLISKIW